MTKQKVTYGLIGHPLGHSFSYKYFSTKFSVENINAEYLNFDIPTECDLASAIKEMLAAHTRLEGFNVTVPYKEKIIPILDNIDSTAAEIGAVNTVRVNRDGSDVSLTGFNTDYIGFRDSLLEFRQPHHSDALILGTGGASKAVAFALRTLGIRHTLVSRTPGPGVITYADLTPEVMNSNLLIVNTTPLGTSPNTDTAPDIPYNELTERHLCYDLVYNPPTTKFMRLSAENGASVMNGSEMLRIQADEAWTYWNKK